MTKGVFGVECRETLISTLFRVSTHEFPLKGFEFSLWQQDVYNKLNM